MKLIYNAKFTDVFGDKAYETATAHANALNMRWQVLKKLLHKKAKGQGFELYFFCEPLFFVRQFGGGMTGLWESSMIDIELSPVNHKYEPMVVRLRAGRHEIQDILSDKTVLHDIDSVSLLLENMVRRLNGYLKDLKEENKT